MNTPAAGDTDAGQRLEPQGAPLRRLQAQAGQRPRRGLEDVRVAHVAMAQHVVEIVDSERSSRRPTRSMAAADTTSSSLLMG